MSAFQMFLLGLGLAMDAGAVAMSNGLADNKMKIKKMMLIAFFFGLFQMGMPLIGYFAGSIFTNFISRFTPWLALILLGFIGGKMIYEGIKGNDEEVESNLTINGLLVQAVATSIDASADCNLFCAAPRTVTLEEMFAIAASIIDNISWA